jgi:perosamine synthetase
MPTVVMDEATGVTREMLQAAFKDENIDARVFFWPLSSLPCFGGIVNNNSCSAGIASRAINLPSYHEISKQDLDRIISVVTTLLGTGAA